MKTYEYQCVTVPANDTIENATDRLNAYGAEGWQFVSSTALGERALLWLMREVEKPIEFEALDGSFKCTVFSPHHIVVDKIVPGQQRTSQ